MSPCRTARSLVQIERPNANAKLKFASREPAF